MTTRLALNILIGAALIVSLLGLSGCGGYTLRGRVIQGQASGVEVIHKLDPRWRGPGAIGNAEVSLTRDPKTLNRRLVGRDRSDAAGEFTIHVSEFGAGWMQEQWRVQCAATGFQNADGLTPLPDTAKQWRLLITLAPGTATPIDDDEDLAQEADRFR